jgi:hypothetical protein
MGVAPRSDQVTMRNVTHEDILPHANPGSVTAAVLTLDRDDLGTAIDPWACTCFTADQRNIP